MLTSSTSALYQVLSSGQRTKTSLLIRREVTSVGLRVRYMVLILVLRRASLVVGASASVAGLGERGDGN